MIHRVNNWCVVKKLKKLVIHIEKNIDVVWALPSIAYKILDGILKGNYQGVSWQITDES